MNGESSYKASKGLIRVRIIVLDEKISNVTISGDFFMYPEDSLWKLENALQGLPANKETIRAQLEDFYTRNGVLSPGVKPEDFAEAIDRAISTPLN